MAEATQTITFKTELTEDEEEAGEVLNMSLDEEMNEGKTQFLFSSGICYFRVFASVSYNISESHGATQKTGNDVSANVEETIQFAGKSEGNTSSPITSITGTSFSGEGSVGSFSIENNTTIKNNQGPLLGVLTINYTTTFDRWKLYDVPKPVGYDDEEDPGLNVIVLAKSVAATT